MTASRKAILMFSIAAIVAIGALVLNIGMVSAADIFVGPGENYTTIQSAVAIAFPFDTIIVRDGTYTENVDINVDNLTIQSENGSENCIVQANNSNDHVFEVTADWVNISGFTVQDATGSGKAGICLGSNVDHCNISENTASYNDYGICMSASSNNHLTGNNASNNYYGGIYLFFSSNNNITNNTANSNNINIYGIYLYYSSNNHLTGNTANSNTEYGILLDSSSNNHLTGNTANSNTEYGIYLSASSTNNYLTGNTANSNTEYGIYLSASSTNNNLTGNNASNNYYGIYLDSSGNNHLTGNTANSNIGVYDSYGIYLSSSSNNYLTDNTASNNYYGIYLSSSSNNYLTDNTALNNKHGIYLYPSSTNNYLTGNNVANNYYDGIYLSASSTNNHLTGNNVADNNYGIYLGSSTNNHIFNNYFDNPINAYDDGTNIWNITKTEGRNIIGGPNLGGNYWSDYTGNDTDGDGLGDTPYEIPGGTNKDYLPLVKIAAPHIFDTGKGDYPSIAGTHNGTIKLNQTITVSKLYTYPCPGTGGHTEYVKIWNSTDLNVTATWNGYIGDWHNISFYDSIPSSANQTYNANPLGRGGGGGGAGDDFRGFTLYANQTYNYTIITGSYPQIIHEPSWNATGGVITCSEFVDINGKLREGWIPAIRLE
jgi:nitrous oxidase accessory protein